MTVAVLPAAEQSSAPAPAAIAVQVVDTAAGLDALRPEWDALVEAAGFSPFQSFEYQRTWWSVFGEPNPRARLHVLVARAEDGALAIAPLFVETVQGAGLGPVRRLGFIGRGDADYLDVLASPGAERCVALLADHLAGEPSAFDVLVLEDLSGRSATPALLAAAFDRARLPYTRFVNDQCPRTPLRETWDATLASLKIDTRREIRRRERNLRKRFAVELEVVSDPEEVEAAIDEFIAMHQHRWNQAGEIGAFADRRVAEVHRRVAPLFLGRGWLFLAFLRLDGRRMVANYCFRWRDELAIFLGGANDLGDARKLSPGRVLTGLCMQAAAERGLRTYDFMRGVEAYKYEFDAVDVPNWTLLAYSPSSRLAPTRYRLALLRASLLRRLEREAFLCRTVAQGRGLLSAAVLRHVLGRLRSFAVDGWRKLRAPERNLAVRGDGGHAPAARSAGAGGPGASAT